VFASGLYGLLKNALNFSPERWVLLLKAPKSVEVVFFGFCARQWLDPGSNEAERSV
jgi:hypothetical protein